MRHHSGGGLSSNLSPSSHTNLTGIRTAGNASKNAIGLKSDTTLLNFDMNPMTATTASSDTNVLA